MRQCQTAKHSTRCHTDKYHGKHQHIQATARFRRKTVHQRLGRHQRRLHAQIKAHRANDDQD